MTQPLSQNLPTTYTGKNLAPIKPLLALREPQGHKSPYAQHHLADAIKAKYEDLIKRDEQSWKEMISVGQLIALFIEGKQILDWNPYSQAYTPRKLKRTDPNKIKAVNFMQVYCTMWQDKFASSTPDIVISPLSNRDQDISKARKANQVVDYLERKMYDSWYNYHEGLLAQIFGWYGNRVRPCDKSGAMYMKPLMEDRETQIGQGFGKCYDCEYSGAQFNSVEGGAESIPACPKCGSTEAYYEPPVTQIMQMQVGEQQVRIPEIIAEQLPFPACRWNPKFRAEDSSWFIYEQEVDLNVIRRILGNVRIPEGATGNEVGMDVMRSLAKTGAPIGGRSGVASDAAKKEDCGVVTELYLSADDLYDIKIQGDEETVDGGKLPIGKRASEVWPNGACFIGLNGMSLLTGIFDEHHSNSLTSGVYHMKPLSGTGRGVADAVEMQKRFNREDSANVRHMETRSRPATLFLAGSISPTDRKLLGQPDVDIPVQIQNFPEIRSIRDIIAPMEGQSIPGDTLQYTYEHLSNFMQLAYHTTTLGGVNPAGIKQNTATYAEIADQNSDSLFTPALNIRADMRLNTAKKAFYLWIEHNPVPRFLPFTGPTKAGSRGMEIAGEDVDGEYDWSVIPGSEYPKNKLSKRRDRAAFFGLFGGIPAYLESKAMAPQEIAEIERDFDMEFTTEDYDEVGEVCRTRFEMAKTLLEQGAAIRQQAADQYGIQMPPTDPMAILPQVRPIMLPTESKLQEKALWFSNLLDTTEGLEMPDEERNLVGAFVIGTGLLLKGQTIAVQTAANEAEMASQAPMMEAQAQQQAQIGEQEAAAQEQAMAQEAAATEQANAQEMAKSEMAHEQNLEQQGVKMAGELAKQAMAAEQKTPSKSK